MPTATQLPDLDALIVTGGFHHEMPSTTPKPTVALDLRDFLADPAHVPSGEMLNRTGLDADVADFVFATTGARPLVANTVQLVAGMAAVKQVVVWVRCAGGKHRAAAVGQAIHDQLERLGLQVAVWHLHVDLDRVIRPDELVAV
ncbi:hypothetical protein [Lentzea sp. NPDC092896]|uniref:RapZ C-terminal domain-containing protein n=1 Tax=Lentzea sp. NPDC092896 TaxID=3364127 RepID=UPI003801E48C